MLQFPPANTSLHLWAKSSISKLFDSTNLQERTEAGFNSSSKYGSICWSDILIKGSIYQNRKLFLQFSSVSGHLESTEGTLGRYHAIAIHPGKRRSILQILADKITPESGRLATLTTLLISIQHTHCYFFESSSINQNAVTCMHCLERTRLVQLCVCGQSFWCSGLCP